MEMLEVENSLGQLFNEEEKQQQERLRAKFEIQRTVRCHTKGVSHLMKPKFDIHTGESRKKPIFKFQLRIFGVPDMNINMDIIDQQFEEFPNLYGLLSDLGISNNDFSVENTTSLQWQQLQQDNTWDLGHNLVSTSVSDSSNESKRQKLMHESPCKPEKKLRKGKRRAGKKEEKPNNGVVHVRARRGQAINGHSLAERVRREKINNKLRHLKELVPGCHGGKGMTVMLDEIINYICSLQYQVQFLSMELAVASSSYKNLEANTTNEVQGTSGTASHEILHETETCMLDEQTKWSTDMCNSAWLGPFNSNFPL